MGVLSPVPNANSPFESRREIEGKEIRKTRVHLAFSRNLAPNVVRTPLAFHALICALRYGVGEEPAF